MSENTFNTIKDFDGSKSELWLSWWIDELMLSGYIDDVIYHPDSFTLFDKVTFCELAKTSRGAASEKTIFQSHIYTADVLIFWNERAKGIFYEPLVFQDSLNQKGTHKRISNACFLAQTYEYVFGEKRSQMISYVEAKPSFDQNNMTRLFRINQKWIYQQYGVYVNLIIPVPNISKTGQVSPKSALFYKTFTPKRFYYQDVDQSKLRLSGFANTKMRSLDQYLSTFELKMQ